MLILVINEKQLQVTFAAAKLTLRLGLLIQVEFGAQPRGGQLGGRVVVLLGHDERLLQLALARRLHLSRQLVAGCRWQFCCFCVLRIHVEWRRRRLEQRARHRRARAPRARAAEAGPASQRRASDSLARLSLARRLALLACVVVGADD